MSLIFSAFRLSNHSGQAHIHRRTSAVEKHYKVHEAPGTKSALWYDETIRIGFHCIWQHFENERLVRVVETNERIVAFTNFPFGYSKLVGDVPVAEIGLRLAHRLKRNPDAIRYVHPPFTLIDVDKIDGIIHIYNDVVSYDRLYKLVNHNGVVISNRSISPFLISLTTPKLNDVGWASEQLSGYMYGEFTAFDNLIKTSPGCRFRISANVFEEKKSHLVYDWFTKKPGNTFAGLDRLAREINQIGDYHQVDIGLTGGRDSRTSAAFAFHTFGDASRGRTGFPPLLERDLAKRLIGVTPGFKRFANENLAVRKDGSTLWHAVERRKPHLGDLLEKGRAWAYILEGSGIATAIYNNCPFTSPFQQRIFNEPSIPGIGGEFAKAYAYTQQQVSGVYASDFNAWIKRISSKKVWHHLANYPPTAKAKLHFVDEAYWRILEDYHVSELLAAQDRGVVGYKFLDFWYLTGRCVGAHTPGYCGSLIMPFFTPEFIATSVQDTLIRKFNVQLHRDLVSHYMPAWTDIPYFDEIQSNSPVNVIRYFRDEEYIWVGPSSRDFHAIINDSPAFDTPPYDRKKMISHFTNLEITASNAQLSNVKAHGLVYRHAVYELCQEVAKMVSELRAVRLRRWKEQT